MTIMMMTVHVLLYKLASSFTCDGYVAETSECDLVLIESFAAGICHTDGCLMG